MIEKPLDVLVFAPHPDDAELAMGGTIAKLTSQGKRVGVVDMTRGETGTKGDPETRAAETEAASKILGLEFRFNLDLGDGRMQDGYHDRLKVIDVMRACRAPYIFTTVPFDRHPDHKAACELVSHAFFQVRQPKIHTAREAYSPKRCFHYYIHDLHDIRFAIDISEHIETKLDAMRAFRSQFVEAQVPDDYRHAGIQDYLDQVEAINRTLGAQIGVKYAEGFYSQTPVAVSDPMVLD